MQTEFTCEEISRRRRQRNTLHETNFPCAALFWCGHAHQLKIVLSVKSSVVQLIYLMLFVIVFQTKAVIVVFANLIRGMGSDLISVVFPTQEERTKNCQGIFIWFFPNWKSTRIQMSCAYSTDIINVVKSVKKHDRCVRGTQISVLFLALCFFKKVLKYFKNSCEISFWVGFLCWVL